MSWRERCSVVAMVLSAVPGAHAASVHIDSPGNGGIVARTSPPSYVCIDFTYTGFPDPVFLTLYQNGTSPPTASCSVTNAGDPGTGQCCFVPPTSPCGLAMEVRVHHCPAPEITQPFFLYTYDSGAPSTLRCIPEPTRAAKCGTGVEVGGPVNVATGDMYWEAMDMVVPGPLPTQFSRRYDSGNASRGGDFGAGFRHSFEESLDFSSDGASCTYVNGQDERFLCGRLHVEPPQDPEEAPWYCSGNIELANVSPVPQRWEVRYPDGEVHRLQRFFGNPTFRTYEIADRNGNHLRSAFTWRGPGSEPLLASISDAYGRSTSFDYCYSFDLPHGCGTDHDRFRIDTLTRPDGQTISYGYDANFDRLTSVTYPDGVVQNHEYDDTSTPPDPMLLSRVKDGYGHVIEGWDYVSDATKRVRRFYREKASSTELETDELNIAYDSDVQTTVTDAANNVTVYDVDRVTKLVQRVGGGPCDTCRDPGAESRSFAYDSLRRLRSYTDGANRVTTYDYDDSQHPRLWNVTKIVEASGTPDARTTLFCYDPVFPAMVKTMTMASAGTCTLAAPDPLCLPIPPSGAVLQVQSSYTPTGNLDSQFLRGCNGSDQLTRRASFVYNSAGQLMRYFGPRLFDGAMYAYHPPGPYYGWLKSVDLLLQTGSLRTEFNSYDAMGNLLCETDPNGVSTTHQYDLMGRQTSRTVREAGCATVSPGDLTTSFAYDDHIGHLASIQYPEPGPAWIFVEDNAHRRREVHDPLGNISRSLLDRMGHLSVTELDDGSAVQYRTSYDYDSYGRTFHEYRVTTLLYPPNTQPVDTQTITTHAYNPDGSALSSLDPRGHQTFYEYDGLGRLKGTHMLSPIGPGPSYEYDVLDHVSRVVDLAGKSTTYENDDAGGVTRIVSSDTGVWAFLRDPAGNATQSTDGRSVVVNRTYDYLNRLTGIQPLDPSQGVGYTYDEPGSAFGKGRLSRVLQAVDSLQLHYDRRGNILREVRTGPEAGETAYAYDGNGNRREVVYPRTGRSVAYDYDAANRVTSVTATFLGQPLPVSIASNIQYLPFGPARAMSLGTGGLAALRSFNGNYTQLQEVWLSSGSPLTRLDYWYEGDGLLAGRRNTLALGGDFAYQYGDTYVIKGQPKPTDWHMLTGWSYQSIMAQIEYVGHNGNRAVKQDHTGLTQYNYDRDFDRHNRLYEIHNNGLTEVGTIDNGSIARIRNRLTASTDFHIYDQLERQTATLHWPNLWIDRSYDGFRRLLRTTDRASGIGDHFTYGAAGNDLIEEASDAGAGSPVLDYVWLHGRPLARIDRAPGPSLDELSFYQTDTVGLPIAALDPSGGFIWEAKYDPFGLPIGDRNTADRLRLPGQFEDFRQGSGLYQNWHRDYEPSLGRYLQVDPFIDGTVTPYAYARSNPLKFIDPRGLNVWIEGPSGNEPPGHQSINVGDPNGNYYSQSFGLGSPSMKGEVYEDVSVGGNIVRYARTTPKQDAQIADDLIKDMQKGEKRWYGPNTCRTYSQDMYEDIIAITGAKECAPPPRPPAKRSVYRRLSGPTWCPSSTTSSSGTGSSR